MTSRLRMAGASSSPAGTAASVITQPRSWLATARRSFSPAATSSAAQTQSLACKGMPGARLQLEQLDLASLASVRAFARPPAFATPDDSTF